MATTLSKEEYLKKYLSGDTTDDKKKKKKKKKKEKVPTLQPRFKIIDNDAVVPVNYKEKKLMPDFVGRPEDDEGEDDEDDLELKPTIASLEDERPEDVKIFEEFKKSGRWKTFEGEDLTSKHIVHEVIKVEPNIKAEPLDDDELLRKMKAKIKKKKKIKIKTEDIDDQIKKEPLSPTNHRHTSIDRAIKQEKDDSPSRTSYSKRDSDKSPRRRQRHDSDASPSRRRHDSDASPPRRRHDSDASPPRRRHDSDASPPRKVRKGGGSDSDQSPPRRAPAGDDSDQSPPRRGDGGSDSDQSPPRRGGDDSNQSPPRAAGKMSRTLDGKRAGLQKARDLKDELLAIRAKEKSMFESMDTNVSGRFAETQVRGRAKEAEEKKRLEKERKEVPEEVKDKFEKWNRGVAQVQNSISRLEDNLYEMSKPLTRTKDDTDRDNLLKDQEREEDPMLAYMRKKKAKVVGKVKVLPKYSGPQPPPNRFNIWPGYRWDGVVRTNGFETKLLTRDVKKNVEEMEAYQMNLDFE